MHCRDGRAIPSGAKWPSLKLISGTLLIVKRGKASLAMLASQGVRMAGEGTW
jgi:hypothetical protein